MSIQSQTKDRAHVLYDGACPFCLKSVEILKRLDWLGRLAYVDMRDPDEPALARVADPATLLDQMPVLPPRAEHVLHGFDGIRWLAWRVPALWLIAPLLYLPGVPQLGRRLYLWIARNRFRLLPCQHGSCVIQKKH